VGALEEARHSPGFSCSRAVRGSDTFATAVTGGSDIDFPFPDAQRQPSLGVRPFLPRAARELAQFGVGVGLLVLVLRARRPQARFARLAYRVCLIAFARGVLSELTLRLTLRRLVEPRTGSLRVVGRTVGPLGLLGVLIRTVGRGPPMVRRARVIALTYFALVALFVRFLPILEDLFAARWLVHAGFRSEAEAREQARIEHAKALAVLRAGEPFWVLLRDFATESRIGRIGAPHMERVAPDAPAMAQAFPAAYGEDLRAVMSMSPTAGRVVAALAATLDPTPVIALGNVAEVATKRELPGSAHRLYCAGDDWQRVVSALIGRAAGIVVVVTSQPSPGVEWELGEIVARRLEDHTLIVGPDPTEDAWADVIGRFRHRAGETEIATLVAAFLADRGVDGS
jgi:hypothetical protein